MCGLAGFIPKNNKTPNVKRLVSLGIFNEDRGTDSCGVAIGDKVLKGIGTSSKFRDFLNNKIQELDFSVSKPVLIHTRKSTNGSHNEDNAHPFHWFYRNRENSSFIFMHNGVITNEKELETKFIPSGNAHLLKIDSHYLGLSLFFAKDLAQQINILETYKGKAAVCFYNETDNSVTIFKGGAGDIEERPLFYVEATEGFYFSSLRMSLELMFSGKIIELGNNQLLRFVDGVLIDSKIIDRKAVSYIHYSGGYVANQNAVVSNTYYASWPKLSVNTLLYTSDKDLIDGEFKIWGPADSSSKTYSLLNKDHTAHNLDSKYSKLYFHNGIANKNPENLKKILLHYRRHGNKTTSRTLEKILVSYANDTIIDIIPLFNKSAFLTAFLYHDRVSKTIQYYDVRDFEQADEIVLDPKFINNKFKMSLVNNNKTNYLKAGFI